MKPWMQTLCIAGMVLLTLLTIQCESNSSQEKARLPHGREWTVPIAGLKETDTPLVMVRIPAGSFLMGSPETETHHDDNESPVHKVTITHHFYMGKYEITQAQWMAFMEENPSTEEHPNFPVNKVSWFDCQEFLKRLNRLFATDCFRLPTEAEREYACRAGTSTATYFGDNPTVAQMEEHAWMRTNSEGELHEVGRLKPNPWGLHDLYGNVWEWCSDWYGPYPKTEQTNPQGPVTGKEKVFRGASWLARPDWIRSADRGKFTPDNQRNTGGFRIVYSPDE